MSPKRFTAEHTLRSALPLFVEPLSLLQLICHPGHSCISFNINYLKNFTSDCQVHFLLYKMQHVANMRPQGYLSPMLSSSLDCFQMKKRIG
jgi:hypothetical protein